MHDQSPQQHDFLTIHSCNCGGICLQGRCGVETCLVWGGEGYLLDQRKQQESNLTSGNLSYSSNIESSLFKEMGIWKKMTGLLRILRSTYHFKKLNVSNSCCHSHTTISILLTLSATLLKCCLCCYGDWSLKINLMIKTQQLTNVICLQPSLLAF